MTARRRIAGRQDTPSHARGITRRSFRWIARWGMLPALLAVFLTSGTHWVTLQAVAYASMIVRYSQDAPLRQAIARTFDGRHPCPLCRMVQKGRQDEEKKRPLLAAESRFEYCPPDRVEGWATVGFGVFQLPELATPAWHRRSSPPPHPPPRAA